MRPKGIDLTLATPKWDIHSMRTKGETGSNAQDDSVSFQLLLQPKRTTRMGGRSRCSILKSRRNRRWSSSWCLRWRGWTVLIHYSSRVVHVHWRYGVESVWSFLNFPLVLHTFQTGTGKEVKEAGVCKLRGVTPNHDADCWHLHSCKSYYLISTFKRSTLKRTLTLLPYLYNIQISSHPILGLRGWFFGMRSDLLFWQLTFQGDWTVATIWEAWA